MERRRHKKGTPPALEKARGATSAATSRRPSAFLLPLILSLSSLFSSLLLLCSVSSRSDHGPPVCATLARSQRRASRSHAPSPSHALDPPRSRRQLLSLSLRSSALWAAGTSRGGSCRDRLSTLTFPLALPPSRVVSAFSHSRRWSSRRRRCWMVGLPSSASGLEPVPFLSPAFCTRVSPVWGWPLALVLRRTSHRGRVPGQRLARDPSSTAPCSPVVTSAPSPSRASLVPHGELVRGPDR